MKWGNPVARRHSHSRGNIERNFTLTGAGTPDLQLQNTLSVTTASSYSGYISQSEEIVIASSWSLATKYIVLSSDCKQHGPAGKYVQEV